MPRKPSLLARQARLRLVEMAGGMLPGDTLPTLEVLGKQLGLHPSTVFRLLRDLGAEGIVWQGLSGRFYPAAARSERVRGLPLCFVGREMWHWSRLYQEILEGVSEVCSANASPLILLSASSLVRQADPIKPPKFVSVKTQRKEMGMLLPSVPRSCGGVLFDHLWKDEALALPGLQSTPKAQLLHGSGKLMPVAAPNSQAAADCAKAFVVTSQIDRVFVVSPFKGDPFIDACVEQLKTTLGGHGTEEVSFGELSGNLKNQAFKEHRIGLICPEDNTAKALFEEIQSIPLATGRFFLFATQGTGLLTSPANRLRFDFRRLGRSAASLLLHGTHCKPVSPRLIEAVSVGQALRQIPAHSLSSCPPTLTHSKKPANPTPSRHANS